MIDPIGTGPVNRASLKLVYGGMPAAAPATKVQEDPGSGQAMPLPRLLEIVADLARQSPPIDYARIAQIRSAIAEGNYKIDASALARAVMQFGLRDDA